MIATLLAASTKNSSGSGLVSLLFIGVIMVVFYMFMIRPQRNRMRQHQELLGALEVGDEVETIGGIYGTIKSVTDNDFMIEIAPGAIVRASRGAVRRKVWEDTEDEQEEQETPGSSS